MRVNVYAEEMTNRLEIIGKEIDGHKFTGLRFYLELPATVNGQQHQGPFIHHPGDDDSSAVTFWGKRDLRALLTQAQQLLDNHYDNAPLLASLTPPAPGQYWEGQGGYFICTQPALLGLPARHLIAAKDQSEQIFGEYLDVPGGASQIDGVANTAALLSSGKKHPAAQFAEDYQADGHRDFHLGSRLDMLMCFICAPHLFEKEGWYWTSTQTSRYGAFVQGFEDGTSSWGTKGNEFRGCPVRWIQL